MRSRAVLLALLLAAPDSAWAARAHPSTRARPLARSTAHARPARPAPSSRTRRASPPPPSSKLDQARAELRALARDKVRRRLHHNWEKAIAALLQSARGRERPAAFHEAAQARYALYRWSADESDREEALRLATRAAKMGVADARVLAQAIRREAGDDRPAPAPVRRRPSRSPSAVAQAAPPAAATSAPPEEDEGAEPALDHLVSALSEGEAAAPADASAGPARVSEVKTWSSADYTRVAVYLSHWVKWQQVELPAAGDRKRRLAIDLAPARLEGRTMERAVGGGKLAGVRAAQYAPDTVRVVLDLDGDDAVHVFRMDDPPRLVLDLAAPEAPTVAVAPAAPAPDSAASAEEEEADHVDTAVELPPRARALLEGGAPPTAEAPVPARVEAEPRSPASPSGTTGEGDETERPIRRIVVDAGHGGHDPGAIGPSRLREKDVTLSMARKLAAKLQGYGFEVVLTRSDDRFLALEERTALANAHRGDLFVSVHANAHPRRSWNGVETYFLNVTDDRYARRLAARENGVELDVPSDLARILTDLDAKASADSSQRLAHLVQREVCGGVRSRVGDVRDLGVKNALFYVLLGARMPAVLVETGFISNRAEEKRLGSARYQDEVAAGIARAVRSFAGGAPQVARQ